MSTIARYSVNFGLAGCYMPDDVSGGMEFTRRTDLAEFIRDELRMHELPVSLFREVNIKRLWSFIKRHGSSTAHFTLYHKDCALRFVGLTEDEFNADRED